MILNETPCWQKSPWSCVRLLESLNNLVRRLVQHQWFLKVYKLVKTRRPDSSPGFSRPTAGTLEDRVIQFLRATLYQLVQPPSKTRHLQGLDRRTAVRRGKSQHLQSHRLFSQTHRWFFLRGREKFSIMFFSLGKAEPFNM